MMKQSAQELRSRIYRLAAERIEAAQGLMPCSEALFEALAAQRPDAADYALLSGLDNADFLEAVFLLLLCRPLDDSTKSAWQPRTETLAAGEFQTAVLRSVLRSAEYQQHQIPLLHCPLPVTDAAPQISVQVAPQQMPDRLVRLYRKLPAPMKRLAKKIAGKGDA